MSPGRERQVEAHLGVEGGDGFRRRPGAEQDRRGIAGDEEGQRQQQGDRAHHGDRGGDQLEDQMAENGSLNPLGACPRNGCALSSRNKGLGEEGVAT